MQSIESTERDVTSAQIETSDQIETPLQIEEAQSNANIQQNPIFEELKQNVVTSNSTNSSVAKKEDEEKVTIIDEPKPKISVETINKSNWHLALSYSGIEGNGLQVLLNSLAEYKNDELIIRYLPKVEDFLTPSLNASMIQYLQDYFDEPKLSITLKPKEVLIKTPKERKIKRHEEDIEIFCQQLTENLCVAKLQSDLGAVIDKQTIKVKSRDF